MAETSTCSCPIGIMLRSEAVQQRISSCYACPDAAMLACSQQHEVLNMYGTLWSALMYQMLHSCLILSGTHGMSVVASKSFYLAMLSVLHSSAHAISASSSREDL